MDIYQEFLIELYKNPKNYGELETQNKGQVYNASCGDIISLYLKIKDGKVEDAKFIGKGCVISQAAPHCSRNTSKAKQLKR